MILVYLGFPCGSAGKESAYNAGDLGLIPGLGRSPGEGTLPVYLKKKILSYSSILPVRLSEIPYHKEYVNWKGYAQVC